MIKNSDLPWEHEGATREKFLAHLAPVALFTYNRLNHTQKTVEALQCNMYAEHTPLIIFSDAPKKEEAIPQVEELRTYLHSVTGFKSVEIIEREENWGLAKNIIDGVTRLTSEYGRVIVIEDDIVTTPWFLKYMNDSLEIYKDEERVMEITGFAKPFPRENLPQTYFQPFGACWGWATWERAWQHFRKDPKALVCEMSKDDIYRFCLEGARPDFWEQVLGNLAGNLNTWAIFWAVAIFQNNGLSLHPCWNMTKNIGMDGTGENCGETTIYDDVPIAKEPVTEWPDKIEVYEDAYQRERQFMFSIQPKPKWHKRYLKAIGNIVKKSAVGKGVWLMMKKVVGRT